MAETVIMPKLGFDMAEGTLVRWVIIEGDTVEKGTVLAEIETDKATVEVESNYSGTVVKHLVQPGDIVPINTPIAIIASPGEDLDEAAKIIQPTEVLISKPADGVAPESPKETLKGETEKSEMGGETRLPGGMRASPLARRMAQKMQVSLSKIKGSGLKGRIVAKDIEEFLSAPAKNSATAIRPIVKAEEMGSKPDIARPSLTAGQTSQPATGDQAMKLSKLRSAIGRRMQEAKQQIPHFYLTHDYDVDALLSLRKQLNEMLPDEEKISVNDFIVKAVALCLRQFPNLNASLNADEVIHHGAVNIGVAVAVDGGLLTVVCRDADRKSLREIGYEVRSMAVRARDFKVRPEDIEGSTFSISNLGMFEVDEFSAIINPPEAAILAVSSARQIPVVKEEQVAVGWRMKATISVDHRVSDGAEAARFMQALAPYLEQPLQLLL